MHANQSLRMYSIPARSMSFTFILSKCLINYERLTRTFPESYSFISSIPLSRLRIFCDDATACFIASLGITPWY